MVGTVSYMTPEQAMGGEVTPRADLYSLGAMLYEMVTGRPPFLGDDSVAIIGQHINTPPVAPTWHNSAWSGPKEGHVPAGGVPGQLQRTRDEAVDGAGAVPAGDTGGVRLSFPPTCRIGEALEF